MTGEFDVATDPDLHDYGTLGRLRSFALPCTVQCSTARSSIWGERLRGKAGVPRYALCMRHTKPAEQLQRLRSGTDFLRGNKLPF